MKVVEIDRKQSEYRKRLEELNQSFGLCNLIECIRFCLEHKINDCNDLLDLWSKKKEKIEATDCLSAMLDSYSNISFTAVITPVHEKKDTIPEFNEAADNLIRSLEEQDKLVEKNRATYSWFFPSICISDLLENIYPDEVNPGMVIGRYLEALFPVQLPDEYKEFVTSTPSEPRYTIPSGSALFKLIKDVSCWAIEKSPNDVQVRSCLLDCMHDLFPTIERENRKRTTSTSEAIVFLQYAPRSFFLRWFHDWLLNENNHFDRPHKPASDDLLTILLCLPFGKGNAPLAFDEEFKGFLPNKSLLTHLVKKDKGELTWFTFSDFIGIFGVFNLFVDTNEISYFVIKKIAENITRYRIKKLSGIFPFEPIDKEFTWPVAQRLLAQDNDLLLMLAYTSLNIDGSQLDYHDHSLGLLPENEDCSFQDVIEIFNSKLEDYLVLVSKAYADGLYEFGTAFLSLYLCYRTVFLKGRHNISPELIETIVRALSLPGAKVLKHTLSFAVESTEDKFSSDPVARASAMILRQFVPHGAKLKVLEGKKKGERAQSEKDVSAFLEGKIGTERWDKLSANSRVCLVSAEQQWRNNAVDFGFGIGDWSSLITAYCKPVEGELIETTSKADRGLAFEGAKIFFCYGRAGAGAFKIIGHKTSRGLGAGKCAL